MADPTSPPAPADGRPVSADPPDAPPPGRYGRERRRPVSTRTWVVLTVLAVLVAAAWAAWVAARDDVHWKDVGFHVDGTTAVDVTFEVTKPQAATVSCTVQALAESYAQVGVRTIELGPADVASQRVTIRVATTQRAVTGTVQGCAHTTG